MDDRQIEIEMTIELGVAVDRVRACALLVRHGIPLHPDTAGVLARDAHRLLEELERVGAVARVQQR